MPNDMPIMKNSSRKISKQSLSSDISKMSDDLIFYAIYGAISLWTFFYYYQVITQPDTFNYLIISEDFLYGRIRQGVNSMWGSLITILIVPFLAVGFSGLTAFKIVQIIIGFFTLHIFLKFLNRFHFSFLWKIFILIPVLPLLVLAKVILTPDLLLLTAVMWYIFLVSKFIFWEKKHALKIGMAGGLMYWSKSYGFPFFVAHFTALNVLIIICIFLCKYFFKNKLNTSAVLPPTPSKGGDTTASGFSRSEKSPPLEGAGGRTAFFSNFKLKKQLIHYTIAMFIFLLISGVWIAAISLKTGQFSIGTAGKYNIALKGNVMNGSHLSKNELINPNTPYTKYWIYHEAGLFTEAWNPFESVENRRHFFANFRHNLSSLYYVSFARDLLILIGLCGFVWVFMLFTQSTPQACPVLDSGGLGGWKNEQIYFAAVAILACTIYVGGYLLVFIQQRYLWLVFMLLWLVFLLIIKNYPIKKIAFIWLVLASVIMTINHVDRLWEMTKDRRFFAHVNEVSEVLHSLNLEGKSVAANNVKGNLISVDADIYLMYEHRFDYWGQLSDERLKNEGLAAVYDKKIEYFFCWDNPEFESELFKKHKLILQDSIIHLSIYKVL